MTVKVPHPYQSATGYVVPVAMGRMPGTNPVSDVYLADGTHVKSDPDTGVIVVDAKHIPALQCAGWVLVSSYVSIPPTGVFPDGSS